MVQTGVGFRIELLLAKYPESIADIYRVLKEFPLAGIESIFDVPVDGYIYVGCFDPCIRSLLVWHKGNTHFYVLKPYRKQALEMFHESIKLVPETKFCIIPDDQQAVINFAKKVGFEMHKQIKGKTVMLWAE